MMKKKLIVCALAMATWIPQSRAQTIDGLVFLDKTEISGAVEGKQVYNQSHFPWRPGSNISNLLWAGSNLEESTPGSDYSKKIARKVSVLVKTADFHILAAESASGEVPLAKRNLFNIEFVDRKTLSISLRTKDWRVPKGSVGEPWNWFTYDLENAVFQTNALIPLTREIGSTYTMVTMYLAPGGDPPSYWDKEFEYGGMLALTAHEAEIANGRILLGAEVTPESPPRLNLDVVMMDHWSKANFSFAGPLDVLQGATTDAGRFGLTYTGAWRAPHNYPDVSSSPLAFIENVEIPVVETSASLQEPHRVKRCWEIVHHWYDGAMYSLGRLFRGGREWNYEHDTRQVACPTSEQSAAGSDHIQVIETQPSASPLLALGDSHTSAIANDDSFAAAMNYQVCLDRLSTEEVDEGQCSTEERDELTSMAELSLTEAQNAAIAIDTYLNVTALGGATAVQLPTTSSPALNAIIAANPDRALSLLNHAARIGYHSGAHQTPSAPLAPRVDSARGKKKRKGVGSASCTTKTVDADDGFQCAKQGVRKRRPAAEQADVISVPARITDAGRYYRPGDSGYGQLTRAVTNNRITLPPGITNAQFNSGAGYIAAIGRDGAPPGQNLSIVYLPNVAGQRSDADRFRYGLQHIWTTREGGHQNDWTSLGVTSAEMLTNLIMSATMSRGPVTITRDPSRPDRQRRNYGSVSFNHGLRTYLVTNVIIVVGDNGMVVTAYPSSDRRNMSTLTQAKELK
ncbi:hypothetical protein GLA29479_2610 [Lysobacter antibioticus]|nr:hypothetical protein GLA29479_2610 [Lysobacter antibioticus]